MAPIIFENVMMRTPPGGPNILSSAVLPAGTQGTFYTYTFAANGGTAPYTWSIVSGTFDSGLTLSSGGVLSGTPANAETDIVVIKCTDSLGLASQKTFNLMVNPAESQLTITTSSPLPPVTQYVTYSETMNATGGSGTGYTWAIISGSLDAGLTFSSAGVFGGSTINTASMSIVIQVTDSQSNVATKSFTLAVTANPLEITTTTPLPNATQNSPYLYTMAAMGGTLPYTWSLVSDTGSNTWAVSSAGAVSGTPGSAETDTLQIKVTDSTLPTANTNSASFTITTAAAASSKYLGMNLNELDYYNPEMPHINLLQQAACNSAWQTHAWATLNGSGTETNEEPWLQTDANGYPTSLTAGNGFTGTQSYTQIQTWMNFNMFSSGLPSTVPAFYPAGQYTFQFTGQFTAVLSGDPVSLAVASGGSAVTVAGNTITSTLTGGAMGSVTFYTVSASTPSTSNQGIKLAITALPSNTNYFRNAAICLTSLLATYNAGGPASYFHPNFLASVSGVQRFRFMDWLRTNKSAQTFNFSASLAANATSGTLTPVSGGPSTFGQANGVYQTILGNSGDTGQVVYMRCTYQSSAVQFVTSGSTYNTYTLQGLAQAVTLGQSYQNMCYVPNYTGWSARTPITAMSFAVGTGCPYEMPMALCNLTGADCWLHIPGWANSTIGILNSFVTSLATLAQSTLTTGIKLTVEFHNEWWNNTSGITNMMDTLGKALGMTGSSSNQGAEYYGTQVAQIADAIYAVYGGTAYQNTVRASMGFASGPNSGGAYNVGVSMNAADWVAQGNHPPWQHPYAKYQATGIGIDYIHMAPYFSGNPSAAATVTFTTNPTGTAGTLTAGISSPTSNYPYVQTITFNDGTVRNTTITAANQTALTWTPSISTQSAATAQTGDIAAILSSGVQATQLTTLFSLAYTNISNGITYSSLPTSGFCGSAIANVASAIGYVNSSYPSSSYPWTTLVNYQGYEGGENWMGGGTPWQNLCLAANRDARMGYCHYDPTSQLSSNPGFLPGVITSGLKSINFFSDTNSYGTGSNGYWGSLESTMQTLSPLASAPPKWQAWQLYIGTAGATFNYYISPSGSDANPGTLASPWSITAINTKQSTYSGLRLGLLPGTYDVSTLMKNAGYQGAILQIQGGPNSSNVTYIGSCNSGGTYQQGTVTIDSYGSVGQYGGGNTTYVPYVLGQTDAGSGTGPQPSRLGNWTIDGLIFSGFANWAVCYCDDGGDPGTIPNGTVQNCTFTNSVCTLNNTHPGAVIIYNATNAVVSNCWFYNNKNTAADNTHYAGLMIFGITGSTTGVTVSGCTFVNSSCIYAGEDANPVTGITVEQCYFDMTLAGTNFNQHNAIMGFGGSPGSGQIIRNNIVKGGNFFDTYPTNGWQVTGQFYNNTWDRDNGVGYSSSTGGCRMEEASGHTGIFSFYNNLIYDNGATTIGSYGYVACNTDGFAVCDYNIYGTINNAYYTYGTNGGGGTGANSFANWKTAINGDAHSITQSANPFTNTGSYAMAYKVQSGSPAYQAGRVGGVSTGATVNVGAWDGIVTQIGCTFST